jgi:hypothetical protein
MTNENNLNADELAKTRKPSDVQLTEEDLASASGGAINDFVKVDPVNGDSAEITKVLDKTSPI